MEQEDSSVVDNICQNLCRMVVVDPNFTETLQTGCRMLSKDGITLKFDEKLVNTRSNITIEPSTGIGKALKVVRTAMKKCGHALYHGEIFGKPKGGMI